MSEAPQVLKQRSGSTQPVLEQRSGSTQQVLEQRSGSTQELQFDNTVVVPIYRNEASLPDLLNALEKIAAHVQGSTQVIFVVDGSPDRSEAWLQQRLPSWTLPAQLLSHSRNFGSFAAIRSGLLSARSRFVAVMAADLQEPPELVIEILSALAKDDADVVLGTRSSRQDPWFDRVSAAMFWSLYRRFVQPEMPAGGIDMFGCNQVFLAQLLKLEERNSSLVGLLLWLGFRRKLVPYDRRAREHGRSAWTFRKKINYLLDSTFAFSDLPLKLLMSVGAMTMLFAFVLGIVALIGRLTGTIQVPGYTITILAISFFGAMNMAALGLVGSYVWRAFENTKFRPLALLQSRTEFPASLENDHKAKTVQSTTKGASE
jgi:polyisoprenyl-phosphate glycosyltransferase